jgi:multidrug efflux pump subunit AcrA (membrane-fusion protein)
MFSFCRFVVSNLAAFVFGLLVQTATAAEPTQPRPSSDRAVTVAQAKRVCFTDTLQVTGVLVPRNEILVRPDREGLQVSQILVEPGDTVVAGQVLARLVPPEGQPGGNVALQAPASGIISASSAFIGATASARAPALFQIVEKGEMELLAETPAPTLRNLAAAQPAKIEIIGVGQLSGNVRLFSTSVNPLTQLGQVRITIGNDPRLRVGAFGRATIDIGRRCGPAIPLSAVLYGEGGAVVQVVMRDSMVESRAVSVGLVYGGKAEIREGVSEGEMVIARAGAFVRDGDRVRPIPAD